MCSQYGGIILHKEEMYIYVWLFYSRKFLGETYLAVHLQFKLIYKMFLYQEEVPSTTNQARCTYGRQLDVVQVRKPVSSQQELKKKHKKFKTQTLPPGFTY